MRTEDLMIQYILQKNYLYSKIKFYSGSNMSGFIITWSVIWNYPYCNSMVLYTSSTNELSKKSALHITLLCTSMQIIDQNSLVCDNSQSRVAHNTYIKKLVCTTLNWACLIQKKPPVWFKATNILLQRSPMCFSMIPIYKEKLLTFFTKIHIGAKEIRGFYNFTFKNSHTNSVY